VAARIDIVELIPPYNPNTREWVRETEEEYLIVGVVLSGDAKWTVELGLGEFVRDEQGVAELSDSVRRTFAKLGIHDVIHEDRERWLGHGTADGLELATSFADLVDEFVTVRPDLLGL